MNISCDNCGQTIDSNDKFCRYCGFILPVNEEEVDEIEQNDSVNVEVDENGGLVKVTQEQVEKPKNKVRKVSKTVLDDMVHEERTIIKESNIDEANNYPIENIIIQKRGEKKKIKARSILITLSLLFASLLMAGSSFMFKYIDINKNVGYLMLLLSMLLMFISLAWLVESYYNLRGLKDLKEQEFVVKKYGFKKPCEIMIDGYVYEIKVTSVCADCEGEIIGDLHIEKIASKLVVVCNMNRKHISSINQQELLEHITQGNIKILEKKEKVTIPKSDNKSK